MTFSAIECWLRVFVFFFRRRILFKEQTGEYHEWSAHQADKPGQKLV